MPDALPLLVPMELQAMVLNGRSRNFLRWEMDYTNLAHWQSPEAAPFAGGDDIFSTNPENLGVYLQWTLPEALRHGKQMGASPGIEFPLVPNRWLVVRYSGSPSVRTATAWIMESDQVNNSSPGSQQEDMGSVYLNPQVASPTPIRLGRRRPLSGWQEPGGKPFLRAVAPGNLLFSSYQPTCRNIFSFHDNLAAQNIHEDTLSYMVVGWYSDASADPLVGWQAGVPGKDFAARLSDLRWSVTDSGQATDSNHNQSTGVRAESLALVNSKATRNSLYHGMVTGISWKQGTDTIPSALDVVERRVNVAVGNTSVDALVTLVAHQLEAQGQKNLDAQLLEAFQYGLLHLLDQPNGQDLLEERIRDAWFGYRSGGLVWEIVDATPQGVLASAPPAPSPEELQTERSWLAPLNATQAELNQAYMQLETLQRKLYELWWKQGYATAYFNSWQKWPAGTSQAQFDAAFDTNNSNSLVSQVNTMLNAIGEKLKDIPHATAAQTREKAADAYAKAHDLPETRRLKANAAGRFWHAADPVVLISGVNHTQVIDRDSLLHCRSASEIPTGFATAHPIPKPAGLERVPFSSTIDALLREYFLLDSTNTPAGQLLPTPGLTRWSQPWLPLYLDWEVDWYPIPYAQNRNTLWTFRGVDYDWTQTIQQPDPVSLSGRSFLTPTANVSFKRRLEQFIRDHPDETLYQALDTFIEQVDGWDFLSQTLIGFTTQLALRDPQATLLPDDQQVLFTNPKRTLADLIGREHHRAPQSLMLDVPRFDGVPPSTFEGLRSGQFVFKRLTLVDRFGQTIEVITHQTSSTFDRLVVAEGLKPTQFVLPIQQNRLVQLPPRLLQDARLNFTWVSNQETPRPIQAGSTDNPIVGWVLPNHLDEALSLYDPGGASLGEVYVDVDQAGNRKRHWEPMPGPGSRSENSNTPPQTGGELGRFLEALQSLSADAFSNLLTVIDETLWTIDPLGGRSDQNLSVLVGRPLAIVRAMLQFELLQEPLRDPRWPGTFNTDPKNPLFVSNNYPPFSVRLGSQLNRYDGLIGYFLDGDYSTFHTVHIPDELLPTSPEYIQKIEEGNYIPLSFAPGSVRLVTMLIDPRASVHAYTGILPTYRLDLPQHFVDQALDAMEITFHVGPLLSYLQTTVQDQTSITKLPLPTPAEKNGVWSWGQWLSGSWQEIGIAAADQTARLPDQSPELREGLLKLKGALRTTTTP